MAAAARVHGIERGKDLRGYPLFAFGGAGPVHAWHVGRILRVPRVIIPHGAGALSAYGLLAAPLAFDFVRTAPQRLASADWTQINRLFEEMEVEGRRIVRGAGVPEADIFARRAAEMRYMRRDTYHLNRPYFSDFIFEDYTLTRYVRGASRVEDIRERIRADGITHLLVRHDVLLDYRRSPIVDERRTREENMSQTDCFHLLDAIRSCR